MGDAGFRGYPTVRDGTRAWLDGETTMDIRIRARDTGCLLVALARAGDLDSVTSVVRVLVEPNRRERLRHVLDELLSAAAEMMLRQTSGLGERAAIMLDLRRLDGSEVDIDELRPEVRAMVRALLAEVNEHPEDTVDQLDLALAGEPDALADGVTLVLMWTVSAMLWCKEHDEPAPGWLAAAAV
jgi:hypothetical protein